MERGWVRAADLDGIPGRSQSLLAHGSSNLVLVYLASHLCKCAVQVLHDALCSLVSSLQLHMVTLCNMQHKDRLRSSQPTDGKQQSSGFIVQGSGLYL